MIVGMAALFMGGAGAPLASAGLGDTAPSMSWDSTKALKLDATPGTGASATILNNTAAPLDVAMQVDVPTAIAVTPATLSIPAGGTKAINVGVLDPAVPGVRGHRRRRPRTRHGDPSIGHRRADGRSARGNGGQWGVHLDGVGVDGHR